MLSLKAILGLQDNMSATLKQINGNAQDTAQQFNELSERATVLRKQLNFLEEMHGEKTFGSSIYQRTVKELEEVEGKLYDLKQSQEEHKNVVEDTNNSYLKMGSIVGKVIGVLSIGKLVSLSDQMVQTNARLSMLGDNVDELGNKIYASAQKSRVSYMDMAENIAKLGMQAKEAFTDINGNLNTNELIAFNEGLNKLFTVSGMDSGAISSVMYNLTQSMSSGYLLGNDYRILKMNSPKIIQLLKETYADGSQEALDKMVSNGEISSQMLKNVVLGNLKQINEDFDKMPMTWGQVWTKIVNKVIKISQPLLKFINLLAQNWSVIEPIVIGIATAVGLYTAALVVNNTVQGIHKLITTMSTIASIAHGAAITAEMTATTGMTGAQLAFNAALYACPLVWIILLIIAIIAIIFVVINLINEVSGTTYSATGVIMGILFTLAAFIFNAIIRPIWNRIAAFVNFFANCFNHPVESIQILFIDLKRAIIQVIDSIAKAIDTVFGTNFSATTSSWLSDLQAQKDKIKAESGYEEVMQELSQWDPADAFNSGYAFGENLGNSIGDAFEGAFDAADIIGTDGSGGNALKTTTSDDLLSEDDVQLLLDVATRDYKLNYQQITPEIVMNFGDIRETADVDDITNALADKLEEVYVSNLGVTA